MPLAAALAAAAASRSSLRCGSLVKMYQTQLKTTAAAIPAHSLALLAELDAFGRIDAANKGKRDVHAMQIKQ